MKNKLLLLSIFLLCAFFAGCGKSGFRSVSDGKINRITGEWEIIETYTEAKAPKKS